MSKQEGKHVHEYREFANRHYTWKEYIPFYCIFCLKLKYIPVKLISVQIETIKLENEL